MPRSYLIYFCEVLLIIVLSGDSGSFLDIDDVNDIIKKRESHQAAKISDFLQTKVANNFDLENFDYILKNILIERVVGTDGHKKVKNFIVNNLEELNWNVELDVFEENTPFGNKEFSNIIATINPKAERYLTLACHYDSKYFKDKVFLGATGKKFT